MQTPDLVPAVAALASLAPYDAEGLDWLAGFSQAALDEVRVTSADPAEARALFQRDREKMLTAPPAQVALEMQPDATGAELAPGIEGAWDDCLAQLSPWGFDVAHISVPVLVLHGGQDRAVPFSHGQWLAARIFGLREGHIEDLHAWLVAHSA